MIQWIKILVAKTNNFSSTTGKNPFGRGKKKFVQKLQELGTFSLVLKYSSSLY